MHTRKPLFRYRSLLQWLVLGLMIVLTRAECVPALTGTAVPAMDKIEPELLDLLAVKGTGDFIIRFAEQADLRSAANGMGWQERGQFVVKALRAVRGLSEARDVARMNPDSLSLRDAVLLISIMRRKAEENNRLFGTSDWTPRKIDKVLWTYGRDN